MRRGWPVRAIEQAAAPWLPGFSVEVVAHIDSTNSELMRRARSGQRASVLLVAEHQSAGRGRLGRQWHSGATATGALTFSIGLAMAPRHWSGLSLAVGVSIARSLHDGLRLKWPNDIWFDERKLAGILIETASVGDSRYLVVGVGVNIAPHDADGLATPPAWLQELLPEIDAAGALARIAPALVRDLMLFAAQGFAPFQTAFGLRDALAGRAITLSDGRSGTAAGVDGNGALQVHTEGAMQSVTSAEISVRPSPSQATGD